MLNLGISSDVLTIKFLLRDSDLVSLSSMTVAKENQFGYIGNVGSRENRMFLTFCILTRFLNTQPLEEEDLLQISK